MRSTMTAQAVERTGRRAAERFAIERDRSILHLAVSLLLVTTVVGVAVAVILIMLPILVLVGLSWLIGRHLRPGVTRGEAGTAVAARVTPAPDPERLGSPGLGMEPRPLSRRTAVGAGR